MLETVQPNLTGTDLFQISLDQYHAMIEKGILTADDPVELVEGVLLKRVSRNPPHVAAARRAAAILEAVIGSQFFMSRRDPISLIDGEPEPDCAVVRGDENDYLTRHPGPGDVVLVVEVSDTTVRSDRTLKLRSYARAGILVYWIVNLIDRVIEVYTDPDSAADEPTYRAKNVYDAKASVPVVIDGREVAQAPVASILP